jgi:hypothetical protein
MRMPAHDLGRDGRLDVGQVEDTGLGRELGVEHDLQEQVAELAGQRRSGPGLQRVVDLVGLLEQVLAQGLVGLFSVPRAAVGRAQPGADGGHRPWPGHGHLHGQWREVQRTAQVVGRQRPDGRALGRTEASDGVIARIRPGEDGQWVSAARSVTPGECRDPGRGPGLDRRPQCGRGHEKHRPGCLEGRRDEPFRGHDLDARGGVQRPAQSCLGEERIEHAVAP